MPWCGLHDPIPAETQGSDFLLPFLQSGILCHRPYGRDSSPGSGQEGSQNKYPYSGSSEGKDVNPNSNRLDTPDIRFNIANNR